MTTCIGRTVAATGLDAERVSRALLDGLPPEGLRLVLVFADWRVDPKILATTLQRALPAPVVGCTAVGLVGGDRAGCSATAIGLYGPDLQVGIGMATSLSSSALARSRDAVHRAAAALGTTSEALEPARHVAITLVDGSSADQEAFCIGSAAAAPQIHVVGGSSSTEVGSDRRCFVWANGEVLTDAGIVILLAPGVPFEALTSQHMVATDIKTVITAAERRMIVELDGRPAVQRVHELVHRLGGTLDEARPSGYAFARLVNGVPYLRSMTRIADDRVHLAVDVSAGQVLRLMKTGDLVGKTRQDLSAAATRVGGQVGAMIGFSCLARHWEAASAGSEGMLADVYAEHAMVGFQSFGEQSGMLLVNHTLTALVLGQRR